MESLPAHRDPQEDVCPAKGTQGPLRVGPGSRSSLRSRSFQHWHRSGGTCCPAHLSTPLHTGVLRALQASLCLIAPPPHLPLRTVLGLKALCPGPRPAGTSLALSACPPLALQQGLLMSRRAPDTSASRAQPHLTAWAPTPQSALGPQPRPPPSSSLQWGGGEEGEAEAPPSPLPFHVDEGHPSPRAWAILPQAALLVEPPSPRGAADPTHRVQATGPGIMGGGPDHTHGADLCSSAVCPSAPWPQLRPPHVARGVFLTASPGGKCQQSGLISRHPSHMGSRSKMLLRGSGGRRATDRNTPRPGAPQTSRAGSRLTTHPPRRSLHSREARAQKCPMSAGPNRADDGGVRSTPRVQPPS
ncbi:hypothetical protein NDU88_006174 [Pleurodeles waltl]|uniref:Uncharacterized protein n=1 Tax=Pleurodeles waltl TaxID=8319 RepID=A0AAV7SNS4_PLEWA|nr:hypothetical protein NDU88_006174 [Pleurodeles waltl]